MRGGEITSRKTTLDFCAHCRFSAAGEALDRYSCCQSCLNIESSWRKLMSKHCWNPIIIMSGELMFFTETGLERKQWCAMPRFDEQPLHCTMIGSPWQMQPRMQLGSTITWRPLFLFLIASIGESGCFSLGGVNVRLADSHLGQNKFRRPMIHTWHLILFQFSVPYFLSSEVCKIWFNFLPTLLC